MGCAVNLVLATTGGSPYPTLILFTRSTVGRTGNPVA